MTKIPKLWLIDGDSLSGKIRFALEAKRAIEQITRKEVETIYFTPSQKKDLTKPDGYQIMDQVQLLWLLESEKPFCLSAHNYLAQLIGKDEKIVKVFLKNKRANNAKQRFEQTYNKPWEWLYDVVVRADNLCFNAMYKEVINGLTEKGLMPQYDFFSSPRF